MTPAPRKQSPSSPATDPAHPGDHATIHPAAAARIRQLAEQAEHRRAIADYQARHLADQQARINALLDETIAALATLLGQPGPHPRQDTSSTGRTFVTTKTRRNVNNECCQIMNRQRGR